MALETKTHLNILCVDNEPGVVNHLKYCLEGQGHLVDTAITIKDAESRLQQKEYDLFVIDPGSSNGDGLIFCRAIRQRSGYHPIIIYSGRIADHDKHIGYEAGVTVFITKPYELGMVEQLAGLLAKSST